ncbi:MAG: hypothetical protein DRP09_13045 [Candidatus Thorarchaeota archaeon]|nr:MAG: hypothetical protein DRP09_13045 [Candidatus Thorarchaeota archaeon]
MYKVVNNKVKFTKKDVQAYLDYAIRHWRKARSKGNRVAKYYVDAFQSVRVSLFGKLLPKEEK